MVISIAWWIIAVIFFVLAFFTYRSKKPVSIYSNIKAPDIERISDLKAYNKAVGKLLAGYALLQALTGILLLNATKKEIEFLTVFSTFFGAILMIILYEAIIADKYIKKDGGH